MNLDHIEELVKIVERYRLASLEVEGIKITKTIHQPDQAMPLTRPMVEPKRSIYDNQQDVLFATSKTPKMTLDQLDRMAANIIKKPELPADFGFGDKEPE